MFIKPTECNTGAVRTAIYEPLSYRTRLKSDAELYAIVRDEGGAAIWEWRDSKIGPRTWLGADDFIRLWRGD